MGEQGTVKLLDTNILMYATGGDHPYRNSCRAILAEANQEPETYGVDVELAQELLDVYTRREGISKAVESVAQVFALFPDPFPITRREIEQATLLLTPRTRLSPRDAIHAAVCLAYGLEGIVSTDKAFDRVPGLTRFDPRKLAAGITIVEAET